MATDAMLLKKINKSMKDTLMVLEILKMLCSGAMKWASKNSLFLLLPKKIFKDPKLKWTL
jgi:hypothetical protein